MRSEADRIRRSSSSCISAAPRRSAALCPRSGTSANSQLRLGPHGGLSVAGRRRPLAIDNGHHVVIQDAAAYEFRHISLDQFDEPLRHVVGFYVFVTVMYPGPVLPVALEVGG